MDEQDKKQTNPSTNFIAILGSPPDCPRVAIPLPDPMGDL